MSAPHSYLITGGCGLQGSSIVLALLPQLTTHPGTTITVISRNPSTNKFPGVSYLPCDISSPSSVAPIFSTTKPTIVFHCAGVMTVVRSPISSSTVRSINVTGTQVLLEEARKTGVKAFIFTSSASVVQKHGNVHVRGADETWPTVEESDGVDIYPTSKAEAERLVVSYNSSEPGGMRTVALRPAVIYGERDNDVIPSLLNTLRSGRGKLQIGNGENIYSFTYIGNSTQAHLLAMEKLLSPDPAVVASVAGEAFFVTNEEKVPFWDFGRAVFAAAGTEVKKEEVTKFPISVAYVLAWMMEWVAWFKGTRPGLTRLAVELTSIDRYFEIGKAKERLGYRPETTWDEGVRRGVEWFLENEKKEP